MSEKTEPTSREMSRTMSAADICRAKGWDVGTRLFGRDRYVEDTIEITAIGDHMVLASRVNEHGRKISRESSWTLAYRDWQVAP